MTEDRLAFEERDFELVGIDEKNFVDETFASQPYWQDIWTRFKRNRGAIICLAVILLVILMAVIGPGMSGRTYDQQNIKHQNLAPRVPGLEDWGILDGSEVMRTSSRTKVVNKYVDPEKETGLEKTYYWFGTDTLGRDLYTRVWEGTRISLYISLIAVIIDMVFGLSYGMISGYYGGWLDNAMQRFVEVLSSIPTLVVVTLLMLVLKPGLATITFALMFTGWIGMSRIARAQVLKIKEQEFVLASKTLGAKNFFIIFREILPNIFGQLIIMSMFSIPNAIFTEAFLAFVGLGVPKPLASLGSLISDAFNSFTTHPYMIIPPVIVLGLIMLSFNLLADGLRDALDPKMKEM